MVKNIFALSLLFILIISSVYTYAVTPECNDLFVENYKPDSFEGVIKDVVCGEYVKNNCAQIYQRCNATIEINKLIKGNFTEGDDIILSFNRNIRFISCEPGVPTQEFIIGSKIRYKYIENCPNLEVEILEEPSIKIKPKDIRSPIQRFKDWFRVLFL